MHTCQLIDACQFIIRSSLRAQVTLEGRVCSFLDSELHFGRSERPCHFKNMLLCRYVLENSKTVLDETDFSGKVSDDFNTNMLLHPILLDIVHCQIYTTVAIFFELTLLSKRPVYYIYPQNCQCST